MPKKAQNSIKGQNMFEKRAAQTVTPTSENQLEFKSG